MLLLRSANRMRWRLDLRQQAVLRPVHQMRLSALMVALQRHHPLQRTAALLPRRSVPHPAPEQRLPIPAAYSSPWVLRLRLLLRSRSVNRLLKHTVSLAENRQPMVHLRRSLWRSAMRTERALRQARGRKRILLERASVVLT